MFYIHREHRFWYVSSSVRMGGSFRDEKGPCHASRRAEPGCSLSCGAVHLLSLSVAFVRLTRLQSSGVPAVDLCGTVFTGSRRVASLL
jgi:hypothetical protein